jgi:large subunit ribosomal protein LX
MTESEVKIFRIKGKYVKNHQKFTFKKYVRALKMEDAMEKVISQVTSSRILRRKLVITEKKIVSLDECEDLYIKALAQL